MTVPPSTNVVRTVDASTPSEEISKLIASDGAVIVRQFIPPSVVDALNEEIDPYLAATITGPQDKTGDLYKKTVGSRTKHMGNLAAISPTYRTTILNHPLMHSVSELFFKEPFGDYWVNRAAVLQVEPGEKAQGLHRDDMLYGISRYLAPGAPELMVNFFVALTEFREDNGATRLIPGSHKWTIEDWGQAVPEHTIGALMQPGDAVLYLGSVWHGAGENQSLEKRRGLSVTMHPAHFTPMEAHVDLSREILEEMTPLAQKMIGWRSWCAHHGVPVWTVRDRRMEDELHLRSV
ncbi:PhyH-domain-containing protein [Aspergillus karnatakaensis]|uniref:phytanoyl-CoA dioxygenase family protein n=1 Tax=Aspergillus karnatakaensis TaxID=1810916 RepID=UPI003CCD58D3